MGGILSAIHHESRDRVATVHIRFGHRAFPDVRTPGDRELVENLPVVCQTLAVPLLRKEISARCPVFGQVDRRYWRLKSETRFFINQNPKEEKTE